MKMQAKDIGATNKTVRRVLYPPRPADPVADMYRKIRDATVCNDGVPAGVCIAALELVKAEILRDMQAQIDIGEE